MNAHTFFLDLLAGLAGAVLELSLAELVAGVAGNAPAHAQRAHQRHLAARQLLEHRGARVHHRRAAIVLDDPALYAQGFVFLGDIGLALGQLRGHHQVDVLPLVSRPRAHNAGPEGFRRFRQRHPGRHFEVRLGRVDHRLECAGGRVGARALRARGRLGLGGRLDHCRDGAGCRVSRPALGARPGRGFGLGRGGHFGRRFVG
jgi:hypothetical protein